MERRFFSHLAKILEIYTGDLFWLGGNGVGRERKKLIIGDLHV